MNDSKNLVLAVVLSALVLLGWSWLAETYFPTAAPQETVESLEVSSPGIERPIRWPEHWRRYVGSRVRIRAAGVSGRPVATIQDVPDEAHVTLDIERLGARTLALDDIKEATLVVDWPPGR